MGSQGVVVELMVLARLTAPLVEVVGLTTEFVEPLKLATPLIGLARLLILVLTACKC